MKLYLSTNMYRGFEFDRVLFWLDRFPGELGVEVFPMFHEEAFEPILKACMGRLGQVPVSFHEPYYCAEHGKAAGTPEYERTMGLLSRTIPYMAELSARYMVFHHNNCAVGEKEEERKALLDTARENYRETARLCSGQGILLAVENAGVGRNALFDEEEFIRECRMLKCPVLIDIGHAHANGWRLENVLRRLGVQIISFHLHNNDGSHDSHRRIHDGTLDFEEFLRLYERYTPQADMVLEYSPDVAGDEAGIEADIRYLLEFKRKR